MDSKVLRNISPILNQDFSNNANYIEQLVNQSKAGRLVGAGVLSSVLSSVTKDTLSKAHELLDVVIKEGLHRYNTQDLPHVVLNCARFCIRTHNKDKILPIMEALIRMKIPLTGEELSDLVTEAAASNMKESLFALYKTSLYYDVDLSFTAYAAMARALHHSPKYYNIVLEATEKVQTIVLPTNISSAPMLSAAEQVAVKSVFESALAVCRWTNQGNKALSIVSTMKQIDLHPSDVMTGHAISACLESQNLEGALIMMVDSPHVQSRVLKERFRVVLTKFCKEKAWESALQLLQLAKEKNILLSSGPYNDILKLLSEVNQWKKALMVYKEILDQKRQLTREPFQALLECLIKSNHIHAALHVFADRHSFPLVLSNGVYNVGLRAIRAFQVDKKKEKNKGKEPPKDIVDDITLPERCLPPIIDVLEEAVRVALYLSPQSFDLVAQWAFQDGDLATAQKAVELKSARRSTLLNRSIIDNQKESPLFVDALTNRSQIDTTNDCASSSALAKKTYKDCVEAKKIDLNAQSKLEAIKFGENSDIMHLEEENPLKDYEKTAETKSTIEGDKTVNFVEKAASKIIDASKESQPPQVERLFALFDSEVQKHNKTLQVSLSSIILQAIDSFDSEIDPKTTVILDLIKQTSARTTLSRNVFSTTISFLCRKSDMNSLCALISHMLSLGINPETKELSLILKTAKAAKCLSFFDAMLCLVPDITDTYQTLEFHTTGMQTAKSCHDLQRCIQYFRLLQSSGITPDEIAFATLIHALLALGSNSDVDFAIQALIQAFKIAQDHRYQLHWFLPRIILERLMKDGRERDAWNLWQKLSCSTQESRRLRILDSASAINGTGTEKMSVGDSKKDSSLLQYSSLSENLDLDLGQLIASTPSDKEKNLCIQIVSSIV